MVEKARILLVDDEESIRTGLKTALTRRGFEVATEEEGLPALVALKTARSRGQPYHYLVLDIQLPDINGLQLLQVIKSTYPDLPVLVISGYGNEQTKDVVKQRQGGDFLDKPFSVQELLEHLGALGEARGGAALAPPFVGDAERNAPPCENAFALLRVAPGADLAALRERLTAVRGVCTCDAVLGDWDLVALVQAHSRDALCTLAATGIGRLPGVQEMDLCLTRRPPLSPETWRVLQDFVGQPERCLCGLASEQGGRPAPAIAYALIEVDPARQARLFVQLHMLDEVIQCDAAEDGNRLVLLLRGERLGGQRSRVPESISRLPGVLRSRLLCVRDLDGD